MEKNKLSSRFKKKVTIPKRPAVYPGAGRIVCPFCGNDEEFLEVAENVTITTRYIQNEDGSFSPSADDTEVLGEIRFNCARCGADLTKYHKYFLEMLF